MKNFITTEQLKVLEDAWQSSRGTPDYWKYDCESYFKINGKSNWHFSGYTCPAFIRGYFKTISGETYIYSEPDSRGNLHRIRLNNECKKLLNIA